MVKDIRQGDARLPRPSVGNVSQAVTVNKAELAERLRRLPTPTLASVLAGLRLLFEPRNPSALQ